jgi:GT2 family glycosyltransferase
MVVFNNELINSLAFCNFTKLGNDRIKLVIIDNSNNGINNKQYLQEQQNIYYIKNEKNVGLCKGMNIGLDYLPSLDITPNDLVVFLNDDTGISPAFFTLLCKEYDSNSGDIFAPIIIGQDGKFYSPARQGFFKNHYIKNSQEVIPSSKYFAIMSGTSASWRILCNYRFDDRIFMDFIDNDFCYSQKKLGRVFKTLNIILPHNLALKNPKLSSKKIKQRYRIWIPDFLTYCKKRKIRLLGYLPNVGMRGIMFSFKSKDPGFFFWALGYSIKSIWKTKK